MGLGLNRIDIKTAKLDVQPVIVDYCIKIVGLIDWREFVFDVISDPYLLKGGMRMFKGLF